MKIPIFIMVVLIFNSIISFGQKGSVENKFSDFENGVIISSENGRINTKWILSSKAYDEKVVGIISKDSPNSKPSGMSLITEEVVTGGIALVKINSQNGQIHNGDPITTSSTPGEGMKATQSGIIVGYAIEENTGDTGFIKIRVSIQYLKL